MHCGEDGKAFALDEQSPVDHRECDGCIDGNTFVSAADHALLLPGWNRTAVKSLPSDEDHA
jgi:hypothetical protein